MTPEQIRARLAAISASLEAIQAGDEGYSDEQVEQVEKLNDEFGSLAKQLETADKIESVKAKASKSAGRKTEADKIGGTTVRAEVGSDLSKKFGGFGNAGNFLMAVKRAGQTGEIDKRFQSSTAFEKVGEDGGFLVPEEISQNIVKALQADDSLLSRTNQFQVSGNSLSIPVDETQPWNGGVQAYWTAEGNQINSSKAKFKQPQWRLHKLAALVKATDELLDDAVALESYINNAAPNAIAYQVNKAIISGDGVGKPQGIINSPFTVSVAAESGQAVDTVVARNVLKMYSRIFPQSRGNAVWLIHPQVEEQLLTLKDDNGNFLYIGPGGFGAQINSSPYGTLLGRPVIPMMGGMPQLGDVGDIVLADLSMYYSLLKANGGVKSAASIHMLFDRDETAFRFTLRIDGKAPFSAPVTTEFGSYTMSAFATLAAR